MDQFLGERSTPVQERLERLHVCRFPLPGIAFTLSVSRNIPANYRNMCLIHGIGNPIYKSPIIEDFLAEQAMKMFSQVRMQSGLSSAR